MGEREEVRGNKRMGGMWENNRRVESREKTAQFQSYAT